MEVTLLIPGVVPDRPLPHAPRLPALERLLARADRDVPPAEGREATLCRLFGWPGGELPVGLLAARGEGLEEGHWLCAAPVHLAPERDRLRLYPPELLELEPGEAEALAAALDDHFRDAGLGGLQAPHPLRWYLRLPARARLSTTPLERALHLPVEEALPRGEDAPWWQRLLTEAQMLLHLHQVNRERERGGRPSVNALWVWGAGVPREAASGLSGAWGSAPLLRGAAARVGIPVRPLAEGAGAVIARAAADGAQLVVWERAAEALARLDTEGWQAALEELETRWLAPLTGAVERGRLEALVVETGEGLRLRYRRGHRWRLWRRPRALSVGGGE